MSEITIIVVDDHPLFRQGVIDSLSLESDFRVVGDAADGDEAMELIRRLTPDVALLDINLPGMNGQQITRQIVAEKLATRVVLVTAYDDREQVIHAARGGASALCAKDVRPEDLIQIVRRVMKGKYVFGGKEYDRAGLERWLIAMREGDMRLYGEPDEIYYPLSGREMEVLNYLTKGLSNKEIAVALGISHQTIKNHVTAILRKLGVEDRTQAAVYALRKGWVRIESKGSQAQEQ